MAEAAALDRLYSASTLLVGVNAKLVKEGVDEFAEVQRPDAPRASGRMSSAHTGARAFCSPHPAAEGTGGGMRAIGRRVSNGGICVSARAGQARASAASVWSQSEPAQP